MSIIGVRSMYFQQKDNLITYYEVATMIQQYLLFNGTPTSPPTHTHASIENLIPHTHTHPPLRRLLEYIQWPFAYKIKKYTIARGKHYWEMLTYTYAVLPYKEVVLKSNKIVHLLIADFWSNQCRFVFLRFYFRFKSSFIARISCWFSLY